MSQKGRLRWLESGVEWVETEGRFRRIEILMKTAERLQQIADRVAANPAFAAQWQKDFPDFPCKLPPSVAMRPAAQPAIVSQLVEPPPKAEAEPPRLSQAAPPPVL